MRKLVFVPILFFVSFLIVLYVVIPNYIESGTLQNQIENKEQELRDKQEYFAKIRVISDNLIQYQEFLDKIEKALPQRISLASLLSFFQDKASGSGLIMENLSPGQDIKKQDKVGVEEGGVKNIKETGFNLTVSGPFVSFENFLKTIEKSSRLIEVKSISFGEGGRRGSEDEDEDENILNFEFDVALKVYSY